MFQKRVEGVKCMCEEGLVATNGFAKRSAKSHKRLLTLNSAARKAEEFRCLS